MTRRPTRREMLERSVLAGVTFSLGARVVRAGEAAPSEKLDLAFVGIGGRGRENLDQLAGQNVVALCDVHESRAGNAWKKFPAARKYRDYRRLLDELGKGLDGVVISTPDHTHFHPALAVIDLGKHLYLEKPMAHSVAEVRRLTRRSAEKGIATQLGVQRHTLDNVHRVVEHIRAGTIGEVRECHAWVDGDRGMPKIPADSPPVPADLDWDLWLGPAAERPYSPAYAPYEWRFWWDFGTGETGNWGCHILDIPFWALDLAHPTRVEASGPPADLERTPTAMSVRYEFPARGTRPPVTLHWHHAKDGPPSCTSAGSSESDPASSSWARRGCSCASSASEGCIRRTRSGAPTRRREPSRTPRASTRSGSSPRRVARPPPATSGTRAP